MADTKISALTALAELDTGDQFAVNDTTAGETKSVTSAVVRDLSRWEAVSTSSYTATPPSTSTITMSDPSRFQIGYPVKFTDSGGGPYYAIVTALSSNALITIAGATLDTGQPLTALSVGNPSMIVTERFFVSGTYGNGANTILATDQKEYFDWMRDDAYLVTFRCTHVTVDTGTEPKVNIQLGGSKVSTNDSNNGVQLGAAGTWVDNSAVAIHLTNYKVARDEALEIEVTVAGGTGDAAQLSVICTFVMEN